MTIQHTSHKVDLAVQWLQSIFVDGMNKGILNVPPPVLTRVFQEMNAGIRQFHRALKIAESPFPFPYTAACEMTLSIHWFITPFVAGTWTDYIWAAAFLSFIQSFILWSLHAIATELQNPFEQDMNDLDMFAMQRDLNARLLMLLEHAREPIPTLSDVARLDFRSLSSRKSTQEGFETAMAHLNSTYSNGEAGFAAKASQTSSVTLADTKLLSSTSTRKTRMRSMATRDEEGATLAAELPTARAESFRASLTAVPMQSPDDLKGGENRDDDEFADAPKERGDGATETPFTLEVSPLSDSSTREAARERGEPATAVDIDAREERLGSPGEVVAKDLEPVEMPEAKAQSQAPGDGRERGCADCQAPSCPKWI